MYNKYVKDENINNILLINMYIILYNKNNLMSLKI